MVQNRDNIESEIILALLGEKLHLRGLAKVLNRPHSTVLRKANELVSANVLDYRMEGKNRVMFIKKGLQAKNYVFNAERYKLIKLLEIYPALGVIIENVLKKTNAGLIILFGSYSKFIAKKESDIDIYVETEDKKIKTEIEFTSLKIKVKIGKFEPDSNLIKEIIKNHVILRGVEGYYEKTKFFE
jgi:predicted nucleotidyltransferase